MSYDTNQSEGWPQRGWQHRMAMAARAHHAGGEGHHHGRRHHGPRGGRRGFGAGGPGFGPGGFGPGGFGSGGFGFGPGFGRRRAGRGDVRAAVLALLAEEPRHGYAILGAIAERSGGVWRPSPGSVYPVLALLEDEGLVAAEQSDGKRVFALTDAGRAYVDEHADELGDPWGAQDADGRERAFALFQGVHSIGSAAREVVHTGTPEQLEAARQILDDTRKALYRLLAGDDGAATPTDS